MQIQLARMEERMQRAQVEVQMRQMQDKLEEERLENARLETRMVQAAMREQIAALQWRLATGGQLQPPAGVQPPPPSSLYLSLSLLPPCPCLPHTRSHALPTIALRAHGIWRL